MLKPTLSRRTQKLVQSPLANGQNGYKVGDKDGNTKADSAVLVKFDGDSWSPVSNLDSSINRSDLAENYGLWTDQKVEQGWGKRQEGQVNGGITSLWQNVRPKDGQVQEDEVQALDTHDEPGVMRESRIHVGAEIEKSDDGFQLNTVFASKFHTRLDFDFDALPEKAEQALNNTEIWNIAR